MKIPSLLKNRYLWIKEHTAKEDSRGFALEILAEDRIGLLADVSTAAEGRHIGSRTAPQEGCHPALRE